MQSRTQLDSRLDSGLTTSNPTLRWILKPLSQSEKAASHPARRPHSRTIAELPKVDPYQQQPDNNGPQWLAVAGCTVLLLVSLAIVVTTLSRAVWATGK